MAAHRWPAALGVLVLLVSLELCPIALASASSGGGGSVLQALLESNYSEWMEIVERAQMLHPLEQLVGSGRRITIFAPQNHQINTQVKSFLLKPANAHLLKEAVQNHVLPRRVSGLDIKDSSFATLAGDSLLVTVRIGGDQSSEVNVKVSVGEAEVLGLDSIVRDDGVVHGIDQLLLPTSVQREFVAFSTRNIVTPLPTGAPVLDERRSALEEQKVAAEALKVASEAVKKMSPPPPDIGPPAKGRPPALASAPGPGPSASPYFSEYAGFGESELENFIQALKRFGGYEEFAGLLVDLTAMGSEISRHINRGRRLTIIAPDDAAWKDALTPEQLMSQTEMEDILRFHILGEYQTEESLYTTVRRNGETSFPTLRDSHSLSVREVDGQVVFGDGEFTAGVFDHDIHTDGSISVQGVDKVLMPSKKSVSEDTSYRMRSVLEMLQLPSRASTEQRIKRGIPVFKDFLKILCFGCV